MTFFVNSLCITSKSSPLAPYNLERRSILQDDILIKITYSGICHTDLHFADDKWGDAHYPMVPGHEIVGIVEQIGANVTKHKVGDCVAVGCMIDSCRNCEQCNLSHEMFCVDGSDQAYNSPERRFPGHITAGGYSEKIVVPEHFTLKVPLSLQTPDLLPGVAPILCAGITTYSPLCQYHVGPGTKVAVAGLGGLGHMAVKLAKALGADVTVISRTHEKDRTSKELGADRIVSSSSSDELSQAANQFDLLLDTIPGDHNLSQLIALLKPYGSLCIVGHVGLIQEKLNSTGLVMGNRKISGSFIGGIKETQDLLDFCGTHSIVADHKIISMHQASEAWRQLRNGLVAERFVFDIRGFTET